MSSKWFGPGPVPPCFDGEPHAQTPVGEPCAWCDQAIMDGDCGVMVSTFPTGDKIALHYECNLRQIIGGLNHLRGKCKCCGGTEPPDPPYLTRRIAAIAAVYYYNHNHHR